MTVGARVLIGLFAAGVLFACGGRSRFREPNEDGGAGGTQTTFDCSGTFAEGDVVLEAPLGATLASPAVAADELELFYVQYDRPYAGHFRRATRSARDLPFADGGIVSELDAACLASDYRSLDLSLDGLRAYLVCFESLADGASGALHLAERGSRDEPFSLVETFGHVGASPALTRDELSLYTSSPEGAENAPPWSYSRSARDEPFVNGAPVAGLANAEMASPEPSPDGLTLFGGVSTRVAAASRATPDAPFGAPLTVIAPSDGTGLFGAPELSADCGTLYYVAVDAGVAPPEYDIRRVTR